MNSKDLIISKLEELKKIYQYDDSKKWNLKALISAINVIKTYDKPIISGSQLQCELKGIGEKIAKRIDEILETGSLIELNNLSQNNDLDNLLLITGVGLVRAKKWINIGIKNIDDVKKAISDGKITSTHHIDIGIKYYDDFQKKIPRKEIDNMKNIIDTVIKKIDEKIIYEICGSYRRGLLFSGDIDVLITHPNKINYLKKIIKELTKINFITDNLTSKGDTKFMGVCHLARRIDIRFVDYDSYYTSLIYFTGSKNFNLYIRNKALENNFSLNEYALTNLIDGSQKLLVSEEEIFKILNIPYLTPNERNANTF
jgi:DNA polymerase beta